MFTDWLEDVQHRDGPALCCPCNLTLLLEKVMSTFSMYQNSNLTKQFSISNTPYLYHRYTTVIRR